MKFTVALLAAVAGLLIAWMVIGSRALALADNDKSAIVALNQ
jgi:uncharacterized integral membrane protein